MTVRKRSPRRPPTQSVAAGMTAFANVAAGAIDPPDTVKLRAGDLPYWALIMRGRARDEWTETDLQHASNLAGCMADIERIKADIEGEGDTVLNVRGTMVVNPKHMLLETLTRRNVYLTRLLHLHPAVVAGNPADIQKHRAADRAVRKTAEEMEDDDLLAQPSRLQ